MKTFKFAKNFLQYIDADALCSVWQPLVAQGTGPDITARLGVVPHHLQPKDPRVRTNLFALNAVVAFNLQIQYLSTCHPRDMDSHFRLGWAHMGLVSAEEPTIFLRKRVILIKKWSVLL